MVLFSSLDEIRCFVEEIMKELDAGFSYNVDEHESDILNKASIRFEYEYKES
jgi:hypothetical protein